MRYLIVIEKAERNYAAYVPDVPGCITTGKCVQETLRLMKEALNGHLQLMAEDGDPIPDPTTIAEYIDVELPEEALAPRRRQTKKAS